MLYAITVSRDITQSQVFTIEAESHDDACNRAQKLILASAKVWDRVHQELDQCDTNNAELEVVDSWPATGSEWANCPHTINLDTL